MGEKLTAHETAEERVRDTAARLRNILDQKNGREKQVLKKYLLELERRVLRDRART